MMCYNQESINLFLAWYDYVQESISYVLAMYKKALS